MLLSTIHTPFCKLHMVCTSQPVKFWRQTSVQAWNTLFDLPAFCIASKQIFLRDGDDFFCCLKSIPSNVKFIFMENNSEKKQNNNNKLFLASLENPLIHWLTLIYIYIYIYIKSWLCLVLQCRPVYYSKQVPIGFISQSVRDHSYFDP